MASASGAKPSRIKVREHRERLREQGLRPIQIWVPDMRSPAFNSEAHRQSAAVAASTHVRKDRAFVFSIMEKHQNQQINGQVVNADRLPAKVSRFLVKNKFQRRERLISLGEPSTA